MEFEWDEAKRESNLTKHGIDFPLAEMLFDGRPVITAPSAQLTRKGSLLRVRSTADLLQASGLGVATWFVSFR